MRRKTICPPSSIYWIFFHFGILKDGFAENDKISVIKEYAKKKGFVKIKGTEVQITMKGLMEFQKDVHDWDTMR